ncbi:carbohydrate esterase family 16 protein [Collybiopsis luxurians FD-317 M1]|uniref:Carbohydrate esterase family 16 protein n=1 Tax=Collybiopsis luxurians FD-317 M1 TaxID=944289 RepID=A0A0D0BNP3_9AGAR|nr:carbohydrate esterase family 16 protein [Collybiopsis luxurians FD-317 M1]
MARSLIVTFAIAFLSAANACTQTFQSKVSHGGIEAGQIRNFVTFGDSYTDVTAFSAYNITSWPVYAARYSNSILYPFAKAAAVCSQTVTPVPFPNVTVFETQLPNYLDASLNLNMSETLFSLWIGTNDLGQIGLLLGNNAPPMSLIDTTACAVNWVKTLYNHGARNFLFQQVIPLNLVPIYTADSYPNKYWTAERNTTQWFLDMGEFSCVVPTLANYMLRDLVQNLPGAHVGIFDTYSLYSDMYNKPQQYYNGTAPLNVKTPIKSCVFSLNEATTDTGNCTIAQGTDRDSYMWWDELHPSEQSGRNLAAQIAEVISTGKNKWTTWLS